MSISTAAVTARENARRADGKFGSYTLADAGTDADLSMGSDRLVEVVQLASVLADCGTYETEFGTLGIEHPSGTCYYVDGDSWVREHEDGEVETTALPATATPEQVAAMIAGDPIPDTPAPSPQVTKPVTAFDIDDAISGWAQVMDEENHTDTQAYEAASELADLAERIPNPSQELTNAVQAWRDAASGDSGDDEFSAAYAMTEALRAERGRLSGGNTPDPVQVEADRAVAALQEFIDNQPGQGVLAFDVSGLQRNRYAVDPADAEANELTGDRLAEDDPICPQCRGTWGTSWAGECSTCLDEYGKPKPFYANPSFLRATYGDCYGYNEDWEHEGTGAVAVRTGEGEMTLKEKGGYLGDDDSIGTEARVSTIYATNNPKAPYIERVVTWKMQAIGPDGNGGSTTIPKAGWKKILKATGGDPDALAKRDIDIEVCRSTHYKIRTNTDTNLPALSWHTDEEDIHTPVDWEDAYDFIEDAHTEEHEEPTVINPGLTRDEPFDPMRWAAENLA